MKSNRTKNLELITPTTLVVGVDGHSKTNTAAFVSASGMEPCRPMKFANRRDGFVQFLERVETLKKRFGFDNVVYVLEPNGPYWQLLARFLAQKNLTVKVVSPLQVKRNRETDNVSPDKNDLRDARSGADLGRQGKFNQTALPGPVYESLRTLVGLRESLVETRNAYKHRLRMALVRSFPELGDLVSDLLGKGVRALLRIAPTAESVVILGVDAVTEVLKQATGGRFGIKKARQIVSAARESVGYVADTDALRLELDVMLGMIEHLDLQIARIDADTAALVDATGEGELLLSIPGIGPVSAAAILGETGGLRQYCNAGKIRKLAGLDLVGSQSSGFQSAMRISKRGRSLLRKSLYQAAVATLRCNGVLIRFYKGLIDPKRLHSLKKKQAIVAVIGKLIDIMFSLVKSGKPFDEAYVWVAPGAVRQASSVLAA